MQMQHTLGKLSEAVDNLKTAQAAQGEKLNSLDKKIYAGIVLVAVFGAIITYFSKSINDALVLRFLAPSPAARQAIEPAQPPIQEPTATPKRVEQSK